MEHAAGHKNQHHYRRLLVMTVLSFIAMKGILQRLDK